MSSGLPILKHKRIKVRKTSKSSKQTPGRRAWKVLEVCGRCLSHALLKDKQHPDEQGPVLALESFKEKAEMSIEHQGKGHSVGP